MSLTISTVGVELHDSSYINKEGKFWFKLEKWELDGFTQAGDEKFKIHFKGVEAGTKEPIYTHTEMFNIGQRSLWRIKQLEVALKSPEIFDIDDWMGRYIIANVNAEQYQKDDGSTKTAYKVKSWDYCSQNDKLPPIPQKEQNQDSGSQVNIDEVNDDEIPF